MTHPLYWCCPLCARCTATASCKHTLTHLCFSYDRAVNKSFVFLLYLFQMFSWNVWIKQKFSFKMQSGFPRSPSLRVQMDTCVSVQSADGGKQCSCRMTVLAAAVTWRRREERKKWGEEDELPLCCSVLWTDTHLLRVWAWSNYCLISGPTSLNEVFSAWSELKFTVIFNTAIIISIPTPQQFLCM